MTFNPEKLRKDFPIFQERPELTYLDNAATTQKPETVLEAVKNFYSERNANVGRGIYDLANEATQEYGSARKTVADFIGADKNEVVFTKNTTESVNLLADSLSIEGKILVPEMSHHSEQLPWRRKAERENLEIEFIETENGKPSVEHAKKLVDGGTSLISVPVISNVYGAETDIEAFVDLARENDALIHVDGAQSVPRRRIDVKDLEVDFLSFSGHKMLGPAGTGVLYGKKQLLKELEPYQLGGGMVRTAKREETEWEEVPQKFEAGTPNVAGAVGLAEAVNYLESVGMENVEEHDKNISEKIKRRLAEIEGVKLVSPVDRDSYLVSFTTEFAHPHDVAEILGGNDVAVRAGHHCAQPLMEQLGVSGTVRASPYLYNTEEGVERLVEAVEEVKSVFDT